LPQPWHLCGQSTGGAIVVDVLNHGEGSPAQGHLILLAPLVRPRAGAGRSSVITCSGLSCEASPGASARTPDDPDFLPFLQADPLQPKRLPTAWVGALSRWIIRVEHAKKSATAADRSRAGGHDRGLAAQLAGAEVESSTGTQILLLPEARHHLAMRR
jgi:alpha-beta hydrolase superfamily lysophospholipase